ncbi:hypothetical protein KCP73_17800 [Salmonella enterica subsp. enterica]|nr:hypothetical protein KCP73_17800 [Salmonella enterica subsp. enterica]
MRITGFLRFIPTGAGTSANVSCLSVYPAGAGTLRRPRRVSGKAEPHGAGTADENPSPQRLAVYPAGAGNTLWAYCVSRTGLSRWRGNAVMVAIMYRHRVGLSPLARGTQNDYTVE